MRKTEIKGCGHLLGHATTVEQRPQINKTITFGASLKGLKCNQNVFKEYTK